MAELANCGAVAAQALSVAPLVRSQLRLVLFQIKLTDVSSVLRRLVEQLGTRDRDFGRALESRLGAMFVKEVTTCAT